jgi:hypothetical protein
MRRELIASFIVSTTALIAACNKNPEPNVPQNAVNGYGAAYPYNSGAAPGTNPTAPGASVPTTSGAGAGAPAAPGANPGTYPGMPGMPGTAPTNNADPNATAIPPFLAGAAQPILDTIAAQHLRGSKADGAAVAARFQAGQVYEQPFTLQPGRCYSAIAVGIGLSEVDVEFVMQQPPIPEYIAATDGDSGPQAVIGENGNCFKNPFPIAVPAKMRVRGTAGDGVAMAQLYAR